MENRVLFKSNSERLNFFNTILRRSSLETWKRLYSVTKIPRQVFDSYKSGKLTIPLERFNRLIKFLNNKEVNYFSNKTMLIDENWGRIKGGRENYKKHKDILTEGRKKGFLKLQKLQSDNYHKFENIKLDKNLAYFVGLWIGDGFSNKYQRYYLTQFVGNEESELGYYKNIICKYLEETFDLKPIIKESIDGNFIRINIYSKGLFDLLIENIGVPKGRKSKTVLIPQKILSADREILLSCIAGIYDAEGCIFFDKRKTYSKPYPRIDLHMFNAEILNQIKNVLDKEGIICSLASISNGNSRILIYGQENIKHFLTKILLRNPKHINRLKELM